MTKVKPIPEGFSTVTPNLVVADGAAASTSTSARSAREVQTRLEAGGMLVYAALRIGGALVTLCDAMPAHGFVAPEAAAPVVRVHHALRGGRRRAPRAARPPPGATEINPVADHVHGDRAGSSATRSATAGRSRRT